MVSKGRQIQHPPPQVSPPAAQRPEPHNPTEVVEAYWRLCLEGRDDEAARYLTNSTGQAGIIRTVPPENSWAPVIRKLRYKIVDVEQRTKEGESDESGPSVLVVVTVAAEVMSHRPERKMVIELTKVKGEWKIFSLQ